MGSGNLCGGTDTKHMGSGNLCGEARTSVPVPTCGNEQGNIAVPDERDSEEWRRTRGFDTSEPHMAETHMWTGTPVSASRH